MAKKKMTIQQIRAKLQNRQGEKFWRSLDELAETEEFNQFLQEEYPHGSAPMTAKEDLSRRDFLKLMGASLVMTMLPGCSRQPLEKIVPYVTAPEEIIPGKPLYFATSMPFNGSSTGLLVESHMGRPTKIEGNPEHVDSLGATSAIHQSAVLGLYDPDRSNQVLKDGQADSINNLYRFLRKELKDSEGKGVRILTDRIVSPTLASQIRQVIKAFPGIKWHQHEAIHSDDARRAQQMVFGEYVDPIYDFKRARTILALDSNFMDNQPGHLRYTREFTARRRVVDSDVNQMNRLYAIESSPTMTGANADHLMAKNSYRMTLMVCALAQQIGVKFPAIVDGKLSNEEIKWVHVVAEDLIKHRGESLVIAGDRAPQWVQALAHSMNARLDNVSRTVNYIQPVASNPQLLQESISDLSQAMEKGDVNTLIMLNTNPVYTTARELSFETHLGKVSNTVHFGLYRDETAMACQWHVPSMHFLEMFSDGRASDGTVTMMQPLIHPLYNGISVHEFLHGLISADAKTAHDIVRDYWKSTSKTVDFELVWRKALHDGFVARTAFKPKKVQMRVEFAADDLGKLNRPSSTKADQIEVVINPDPAVWDGRFANNGWLQELPKPLTKITWDNALLVSPATAEKYKLENEDMVEVSNGKVRVSLPVWIVPGHCAQSVSAYLGYGRKHSGALGNDKGFNVTKLQTAEHQWRLSGATISKLGIKYGLASTQIHHSMHGRELVRSASLDEYKHHPDFAHAHAHGTQGYELSMYPQHPDRAPHQWGMTVNLNQCVGCNACVTACQSENNTPVVGKEEVRRGREMHWIRVDNYYEGEIDQPTTHHQPVMCMHCENAPCEPVCPVQATGHSDEGLNEMTYNRCVGTRYCSNNCPYKVRRFNFFQYADKHSEPAKLRSNPDVTVRNRGVMEKCTFCVQRINQARITAKKENRDIKDGEVVTACQAVCPAEAISFGNIRDPQSEVSRLKESPLNYGLLTELNTFPRLSYLARVRNPNPKLETHKPKAAHVTVHDHSEHGGGKH